MNVSVPGSERARRALAVAVAQCRGDDEGANILLDDLDAERMRDLVRASAELLVTFFLAQCSDDIRDRDRIARGLTDMLASFNAATSSAEPDW